MFASILLRGARELLEVAIVKALQSVVLTDRRAAHPLLLAEAVATSQGEHGDADQDKREHRERCTERHEAALIVLIAVHLPELPQCRGDLMDTVAGGLHVRRCSQRHTEPAARIAFGVPEDPYVGLGDRKRIRKRLCRAFRADIVILQFGRLALRIHDLRRAGSDHDRVHRQPEDRARMQLEFATTAASAA